MLFTSISASHRVARIHSALLTRWLFCSHFENYLIQSPANGGSMDVTQISIPMKRRNLIKTLALATLSGGGCLLGTSVASAETKKPRQRGLAIGQSLRYDDGLKLIFVRVRNDSRCPAGVNCISAGDAEVVLLAYVGKQPAKIIRVHTDLNPQMVILSALPPGQIGIPKTYSVRVDALNPSPKVGANIKQSDYRVVLGVSVAV